MVLTSEIIRAAISYSKHRNKYGIVITNIDRELKKARVTGVHQWDRTSLSKIPEQLSRMYRAILWDHLYIDQLLGQDTITRIKNLSVPIRVITTSKDMKDPKHLEKIKVMDINEMMPTVITLGQLKGTIEFSPTPTKSMQALEEQFNVFQEKTTEQGGIAYYAPGDLFDDLVRAFLINIFSARKLLQPFSDGSLTHVMGGISATHRINMTPKSETDEDILQNHYLF